MGFKIFINFVQPAFLSVETYAMIQTFNLYVSYVGLFHLGYVDGIYLKYGGKKLEECDQNELCNNVSSLRTFQLVITFIVIIIGFCINDIVLLAVGCSVLPANIASYYRMLYQATGNFKMYGRIMNINTILLFIYNIILIFLFHVDDYYIFFICEITIYIIMHVIIEVSFFKKYYSSKISLFAFNKHEIKTNISEGLPLTIGNLSSVLFTSLDRWFVKFLLTSSDFAYYSFAVSIETFMNVAISPVTITLYNYFCSHKKVEEINRIKNLMMIFAVFIVSCAFPARFIVEKYISKYTCASEILFVLFSSKILSIIIQGIYVNLYKSYKRQREYLVKLIVCIFVGVLFNALGFLIFKGNISFAFATLATVIVWFFISARDFKMVSYSIKDIIYIGLSISFLNVFGLMFSPIYGFILYLILEICLSFILQRENFVYSIKSIALPTLKSVINIKKG